MTIAQQQKNELTEYHIYKELAKICTDPKNKITLHEIAEQELEHYEFWKGITGRDMQATQTKVHRHILLAKIFGLSFSLRLLEKNERKAEQFYASVSQQYPEALRIKAEELEHEQKLIKLLHDYRLIYAGAIVLGLNDALVEFTGTLAGLTFAFSNNRIVGMTGLVMGVAASLSMAASGYFASKEEDTKAGFNPVTAAIYTGLSYILTVFLLIAPYLLQNNPLIALSAMLLTTLLIIAAYTYYISIAKAISFKKRFTEMALISLGVAAISFGIGIFVKNVFGLEI